MRDLSSYQSQGLLALRHRSLPDDFTGDYKIEVVGLHPFPRLFDHEALAIETGIDVGAVTVLRVDNDVFVFLDDIDDMQFYSQLLRGPQGVIALRSGSIPVANRMGMTFDAEPGKKIDTFDMDTLIKDNPGCEH